MKKYILSSLLVMCVSLSTYAQKETSIWYFGFYAGLDFNQLSTQSASDGTPVDNMPLAITSPLATEEGCFTLSNSEGRLLFSSDGTTVYESTATAYESFRENKRTSLIGRPPVPPEVGKQPNYPLPILPGQDPYAAPTIDPSTGLADGLMKNGNNLYGGSSSTQSGIVIPRPGSLTEYYIVTVAQGYGLTDLATAPQQGIRYSVVDMTQNGGEGAITNKNISILPTASEVVPENPTIDAQWSDPDLPTRYAARLYYEKNFVTENLAAIPNRNGVDFWLIHRSRYGSIYVWAVTAEKIDAENPQIFTFFDGAGEILLPIQGFPWLPNGAIDGTKPVTFIGETFASSDYQKIAGCMWNNYGTSKNIFTAEFNNSTGVVSNLMTHYVPQSPSGTVTGSNSAIGYGGCFSPNDEYVYMTTAYYAGGRLLSASWDDLRAEATTGVPALTEISRGFSNVSKALDGRLYGILTDQIVYTNNPTRQISVVLDPDNGGTNIKFFPTYLVEGTLGNLGLPTFAAGYIKLTPKQLPFACAENYRTYSIKLDPAGGRPNSLVWNFGDGKPVKTQAVVATTDIYTQKYKYDEAKDTPYLITIQPVRGSDPIPPIYMDANVVNCNLKTNKMARVELLNTKELEGEGDDD